MNPYLIQRLLPAPSNETKIISQILAFGGGGSGMGKEAWELVQSVVDIDYMGSAEFEFGAFPKCLYTIAHNHTDYTAWEFQVSDKQIAPGDWRKWKLNKDGKFKKGMAKVVDGKIIIAPSKPTGAVVYVIGPSNKRKEVEDLILLVGNGKAHLKDSANFYFDPDPCYIRSRPTIGWLDICNNVAWFSSEDTARKFATILGVIG